MTSAAFFLLGILLGASGAMFITSMRSATKPARQSTDILDFLSTPITATDFETFVRETQR